jgi:hypothetical protein
MATLGSILSSTDVSTKGIRSGTISLIITDLTKAVTFSTAMPSANYRVFLSVEGNLAAVLWPSAKLTTGFTLNLSVGVVGSVAYLCVED